MENAVDFSQMICQPIVFIAKAKHMWDNVAVRRLRATVWDRIYIETGKELSLRGTKGNGRCHKKYHFGSGAGRMEGSECKLEPGVKTGAIEKDNVAG
jgi:hypothetical protein